MPLMEIHVTKKFEQNLKSIKDKGILKKLKIQIEKIDEKSLAERLRLEPGDVVTSVNGVEVKNLTNLLKVLRGLRSGAEVVVEVERNGDRKKFSGNLGPNVDPEAQDKEGPVHEVRRL